jgi:hypothetical protein
LRPFCPCGAASDAISSFETNSLVKSFRRRCPLLRHAVRFLEHSRCPPKRRYQVLLIIRMKRSARKPDVPPKGRCNNRLRLPLLEAPLFHCSLGRGAFDHDVDSVTIVAIIYKIRKSLPEMERPAAEAASHATLLRSWGPRPLRCVRTRRTFHNTNKDFSDFRFLR